MLLEYNSITKLNDLEHPTHEIIHPGTGRSKLSYRSWIVSKYKYERLIQNNQNNMKKSLAMFIWSPKITNLPGFLQGLSVASISHDDMLPELGTSYASPARKHKHRCSNIWWTFSNFLKHVADKNIYLNVLVSNFEHWRNMDEFALIYLLSFGKLWKSGGLLDLVFFAAFVLWSFYLSMLPAVLVPWNPALLVDEPKKSKISGMSEKIKNLAYEWRAHPKRRQLVSGDRPNPACGELGEVPDLSRGVKNKWQRKHQTSHFNPSYKLVQLLICLGFRTGMTNSDGIVKKSVVCDISICFQHLWLELVHNPRNCWWGW